MLVPLDIAFRSMERDQSIVRLVQSHVKDLEEFFDMIIGCHVFVEALPPDGGQSDVIQVRIQVVVPCEEIVVVRQTSHLADVRVTISDAFQLTHEQLVEHVRELRTLTNQTSDRPQSLEAKPS